MNTRLPATRSSNSLVAPAGTEGPIVHHRGSAVRQLIRTARSAAELVLAAADAVAERVLDVIGPRR